MKKIIVTLFVLSLLLLGVRMFYMESNKNETFPDDIIVKATLKPNTNPRMDYKDVMLEVSIDKSKNSQHMIYPYIPGLQYMSFDSREEEGFFIPTSIGSGYSDEQKVYETLINNRIIDHAIEKEQIHYIGFWSPQDAGDHQMRLYFENEGLKENNEMYLIYVHKEEGAFGQDLGWTKLVKVETEL